MSKAHLDVVDPLEDDVDLAVVDEEPQDIDPMEWLTSGGTDVTGYVNLGNGRRLKIAALTDEEELRVQRLSLRPDKSNPRRQKREFAVYKRIFVATSLNKASGAVVGAPNYIDPNELGRRPVGELTKIMTEIMKLSGMDVGRDDDQVSGFFD